LEERILKGLGANFSEVRIVKDLEEKVGKAAQAVDGAMGAWERAFSNAEAQSAKENGKEASLWGEAGCGRQWRD
jgi:hypothetical protein